jgi:prepilin-type N-terminal cleavage/methylation domain-containing protein
MATPMRLRDGFTLVEILAALMISGIAVAIAAGVFTNVAGTIDSLQSRSEEFRLESEAMRWLRDGLLSTDVSLQADREFTGTAENVSFTAWLPASTGWSEPTRVEAFIEKGRFGVRTNAAEYTAPDSLEYAAFDYLAGYGSVSPWLVQWDSRTGAPLALRLRRGYADGRADTTLLYVGRGQ